MKTWDSDQKGAVTVPLALALVIVASTAFGLWSYLAHWRRLAETQMRLDECVGQVAIELRSNLNSIETINRNMKILRVGAAITSIIPPVAAAARAALIAEAVHAEYYRLKWTAKQATWLIKRGCGVYSDIAKPLPSFPWTEVPPDILGPKPLRWNDSTEGPFYLSIRNHPRFAAAEIFKNTFRKSGGDKNETSYFSTHNWQCQWTSHP